MSLLKSFWGEILELRPYFYALICVMGQLPEIQIDIVNRVNSIGFSASQIVSGKVYVDLIVNDPERVKYGFLPLMASCSDGEIGALNAESFSERILSNANDVMTSGNTLLGDEELEILRMNRDFIEFMRAYYNHVSLQQFQQTVVREADNVDDDA